jgi:hypothetical protein
MPTGYTAAVSDGKITELKDFIWQCARAMGALVMMRDEPSDAPIPEKFEPSPYYKDKFDEAKKELDELLAMAPGDLSAAAIADFDERVQSWRQSEQRKLNQIERYRAMIAKVEAWKPPSCDHVGLKDFMLQQLSESIRFDTDFKPAPEPKPTTGEEWRAKRLKELTWGADYYAKNHAREVERVNSRNEWLAQLRRNTEAL